MQPTMSVDQIREIIESNFPDLQSKPLEYGWSFRIEDGDGFTRIVRVTQASPNRKIDFKPAITARLENNKRKRIEITGGENQICEVIGRELQLWRKLFRK